MLKKLFGAKKDFFVQLDENDAPVSVAVEETVVAVVEPEEAPAETAPKKTSAKKKSAKKAVKTSAPVETSEPEVVAVPTPKVKMDPSQVAFASADPVPQNVARRNPGPSLNRFKEMARQVKTKAR